MSLDGIILVNKPQGVGPFDCTYKVRDALNLKQVSHIEALEPRVEGVLPIFTGKATKLLRLFKGGTREYFCEITLGYSTTTEDVTGKIIDQKVIKRKPSVRQVEKVLKSMLGPHMQISPMYSAALFEGRKLHEYKQEGIEIPVEKRPIRAVEVLDIALESEVVRTEDLVKFSCYVKCSDGTFIRSLAAEIGEKLGYPAHMSHLKRLSVGPFNLSDSADYETLAIRLLVLSSDGDSDLIFSDQTERTWFIPFKEALAPYQTIMVDEEIIELAKKRARIPCEKITAEIKDSEPFIILSKSEEPLAIYALERDLERYHALSVLTET